MPTRAGIVKEWNGEVSNSSKYIGKEIYKRQCMAVNRTIMNQS